MALPLACRPGLSSGLLALAWPPALLQAFEEYATERELSVCPSFKSQTDLW